MSILRRRSGEYIPVQVRRIVLYQSEVLRCSSAQIAVHLDLPLRTVQYILHRWNILLELVHEPRHEGSSRALLDTETRKFIKDCLESCPDLLLDELKDELWFKHRISVHLSTLSRTLQDMDMPLKSLSKRACEASVEKRVQFISQICMEPPERLVFVDESAVNGLTGIRTRGRAPKGKRAYKTAPFTRQER
ncbi:hypothetical protein BKA62DRAFT_622404 [Auriculariales sp. MPI-PUGE-AT-0066]|nr:hypothetical protein BKA62DRAFT_622404 [Auriculariales sp. MPI-PUGE-AT-0066]